MLQFPLPSYNTLVVLDHAKCQCKWKKCLKIFKNNINKMQHDGLKLWFNLMMGTILLYFKNFLCVLMAKIMAKQKKKKNYNKFFNVPYKKKPWVMMGNIVTWFIQKYFPYLIYYSQAKYSAQKMKFSIKVFPVNVTKSAGNGRNL